MKRMLLAFFFCTLAAFAGENPAPANAASACGPAGTNFVVKPGIAAADNITPDSGKAVVYLVGHQVKQGGCLGGRYGCGATARIGVDGQWVGAIKGDMYLPLQVDAGEHHLCVRWQSVFASRSDVITLAKLQLEAGKTYYYRVKILYVGDRDADMDIEPLDEDEARYQMSQNAPAAWSEKK
ncbi:MAG TPA: hypothetical protein VGL89_15185 [Candidatus Koribacter sp.]|jgi:hypothetical protein